MKNTIIGTRVEANGPDKAFLTVSYGDGLEATAEITHGAAVELTKQLQAWTCRKTDHSRRIDRVR